MPGGTPAMKTVSLLLPILIRRPGLLLTSSRIVLVSTFDLLHWGVGKGCIRLMLGLHLPLLTVMFADVEGFTAWSSVREPSQVFTLLETIYAAFDRVASRRRVFKVETVGDSYVAVSGLPEPREDHAVTMARFARDCIAEHIAAVKKLESSLGPETGDLRIRVGLHSGPITAGVLRGERSRFQVRIMRVRIVTCLD
jgi:class 3 adenylate cyclase